MGVLRNLEAKLEHLVEGIFSRTFRSQVQPVELARKLAREMEAHKTVSISRTYVPNEYTVYLSAQDHGQVESYAKALSDELATYLLEHARREDLTLLTRPAISFLSDERLHLGEFGIQTRLVKPPTADSDRGGQGDLGQTMVYSSLDEAAGEDVDRSARKPQIRASLVTDERRYPLEGQVVVVGRSTSCDIVLDDHNVSRAHVELSRDGEHWFLNDLGSMNGTEINGRRVDSTRLTLGDELVIGKTHMTFDIE